VEPPSEEGAPSAPVTASGSPIIQEAACSERVIVLKIRVPGVTSFVIIGTTRAGRSGVGLVTAEARREIWGGRLPPGTPRQAGREAPLIGARLVALDGAEAFIEQNGVARVIRSDHGRVVITDGTPPGTAAPFLDLSAAERLDLEAKGIAIAGDIAADATADRRAEVVRALEQATRRIERRREAIRGDIGRIEQADKVAAQATWLVAEAARTPRGATKLVVTDWSTGEAVPMVVPLDPARSAKEQVEAMFKRAKRLRLGAQIAMDRLAQADRQYASIEEARRAAADAPSLTDLEEILRSAKRDAPRDVTMPAAFAVGAESKKSGKGDGPRKRTPHRAFFARSGRRLLVGKGAADNDALTLHVARPHDLWLHAKDRAGAHVIVPLDKGQTCPAEDLVDAAHLAAHFSEARDEKVVDVEYASRRFIRKPKGSPAGFVVVDREKVLVLRTSSELLRDLLAREEL
jgi:hypothetical protein